MVLIMVLIILMMAVGKQDGPIAPGIGVATAVECTWRCSRSSCPRCPKSRVRAEGLFQS
jgi:hypothetical protein